MKYDFTQFIDRMGKDAIAVEFPPNGNLTKPEWKDKQIPMWVADQNFPTFPPIKEKMRLNTTAKRMPTRPEGDSDPFS